MTKGKEETLIEHLEALRLVLIKCFLALAAWLVPMFFCAPYVMDALIKIMTDGRSVQLNFFAPMEVFVLQIKMALLLDFALCFPYIARQIWHFVLPALYDNERCFIKSVVWASSALFVVGAAFCLFFILPFVIRFAMSFESEGIRAMFGINNVVSLALWLILVFGIMFQFPLIVYALIRFNVASYEAVKSKRVYVFVGILVLSALLTPPDIVSQSALALPTYALFEVGLFFGRKKIKKSPLLKA